jgi:hypothetical protein
MEYKELKYLCKQNRISPNQYFYLLSLYNNDEQLDITKDEKDELVKRDFIFNLDNPALRKEGMDLFEEENLKNLFNEFWEAYPTKTPNGRLLKSEKTNTKNYNDAWSIYKKRIRKKSAHDELMNGLTAELASKSKTNSLNYLNNVVTWLRSMNWQLYDINSSEVSTDGLFTIV